MRCEAGCFKPSSRQLPHAWLLGGGSGLESYFPQSEVSLVLGVMTDFQLKPGHFRRHVTRLWVFLKHGTVPAGSGCTTSLRSGRDRSPGSPRGFHRYPRGKGNSSVLLSRSGSSSFATGLHWYSPSWEGRTERVGSRAGVGEKVIHGLVGLGVDKGSDSPLGFL